MGEDLRSSGVGLRGFKSHPPHLKSEPILSLFQPKNTNLRCYGWGLEIEHTFTGKSFFNLRKVENKNGKDRTCQVELVLQIVSKTKKRGFAGDISICRWFNFHPTRYKKILDSLNSLSAGAFFQKQLTCLFPKQWNPSRCLQIYKTFGTGTEIKRV